MTTKKTPLPWLLSAIISLPNQSRSADRREGHGSSPCCVLENGIFGSNNGHDSAVVEDGLCGSYDSDL